MSNIYNPPFKKTELALAVSVICSYWKQINEYYRWNESKSSSESGTNGSTK